METIEELYVHTLKDVFYAETKLSRVLPKLAKKSSEETLKQAFEKHAGETEQQLEMLRAVFDDMGKKAAAEKCDAIDGILEEGSGLLDEVEVGPLRDLAVIGAARAAEHYEIARYSTLLRWAEALGRTKHRRVFLDILQQEEATDEKLHQLETDLAQRLVANGDQVGGMSDAGRSSHRGRAAKQSAA
jgi:ferritin-like metal-binding protein YciE